MANVCEGYSYALAAQDVIPIVLGGAGFVLLAKRFSRSIPELAVAVYFAATILIVGSAVAGPIRKAFLAGGYHCEDLLEWMQIPFFTALPTGFAILAWAAYSTLRGRKTSFWPFALMLSVVYLSASLAERSIILLASSGLFAVGNAILCSILAKRDKDVLTSVLFVLYALGTLALPALASNENRSAVANQWIEQGTNTVAQTIFVIAAYRLLRAATPAGTRPAPVER